jgi:hypothetical protein
MKNKHDRRNAKLTEEANAAVVQEIAESLPAPLQAVAKELKLPSHVEAGLSMYFAKSDKNDINLVTMMTELLNKSISKEAAVVFANRPEIIAVGALSSLAQRVIINRYFRFLLMQHRALSDTPTLGYAQALVNDGSVEDWLRLFNDYVLPFLNENNVFTTVYDIKKG